MRRYLPAFLLIPWLLLLSGREGACGPGPGAAGDVVKSWQTAIKGIEIGLREKVQIPLEYRYFLLAQAKDAWYSSKGLPAGEP